jgi:hypothetical protein
VKLRGCITATLAVLHASVVGGVGFDFRTPMPCLSLDFRALFDWRGMGSLQRAREQRISSGAHSRGEGSRARTSARQPASEGRCPLNWRLAAHTILLRAKLGQITVLRSAVYGLRSALLHPSSTRDETRTRPRPCRPQALLAF